MAYLLWIDLETTGLDPTKEKVLEIAAILTDFSFNEIERREWVIGQSQDVVDAMNDWCKTAHGNSGLIEECLASKVGLGFVEELLVDMAGHGGGKAHLAGNSVHFDRAFIFNHMPKLYWALHHRIVDISTLNVLADEWKRSHLHLPKAEVHRAMDDIEESIRQAKLYRASLFGDV